MTDVDLIGLAGIVLDQAPRNLGADRTVAAALLARQALEEALDAWWEKRLPAMVHATDRDQQVSLPFYLDEQLAGDITWTWNRLSYFCHHTAYEMPPPEAELRAHLATIARLTALIYR